MPTQIIGQLSFSLWVKFGFDSLSSMKTGLPLEAALAKTQIHRSIMREREKKREKSQKNQWRTSRNDTVR